jgi:hypothetical protein
MRREGQGRLILGGLAFIRKAPCVDVHVQLATTISLRFLSSREENNLR